MTTQTFATDTAPNRRAALQMLPDHEAVAFLLRSRGGRDAILAVTVQSTDSPRAAADALIALAGMDRTNSAGARVLVACAAFLAGHHDIAGAIAQAYVEDPEHGRFAALLISVARVGVPPEAWATRFRAVKIEDCVRFGAARV